MSIEKATNMKGTKTASREQFLVAIRTVRDELLRADAEYDASLEAAEVNRRNRNRVANRLQWLLDLVEEEGIFPVDATTTALMADATADDLIEVIG